MHCSFEGKDCSFGALHRILRHYWASEIDALELDMVIVLAGHKCDHQSKTCLFLIGD